MRILVLLPLIALAACVRPSAPPPAPAPVRPAPAPAPTPPPAPAPLSSDWRDWPITPGTWSYASNNLGSTATFAGPQGRLFVISCDNDERIRLHRMSATAGSLTIRTTSVSRTVPASPIGHPPVGVAASLAPRDPLLDAMAFSRGRFIVETAGMPYLAVPAWAEVARVTEDCR